MPKFCGSCGAAVEGQKFCTSCGAPVQPAAAAAPPPPPAPAPEPVATPEPEPAPAPVVEQAPAPEPAPVVEQAPAPEPAPTRVQPVAPAPPTAGPPPYGSPAGHAPGPTAHAPGPAGGWQSAQHPAANPFHGVPWTDFVRDGVAVVLLFTSLGLPWDYNGDGADRWWVVVSVLFAVLAVPVSYFPRAGVVPGFGTHNANLVRLGLCLPMAVSVLVAVVNELVAINEIFSGSLGASVAVATLGAGLAGGPRAVDAPATPGRSWPLVTRVVAGLAVGAGLAIWLAVFLRELLSDYSVVRSETSLLVYLILGAALVIAAVGLPVVWLWGGAEDGRRILAVSCAVVLAADALSSGSPTVIAGLALSKWTFLPAGALISGGLFLAVALAVLVAPPVVRLTADAVPVRGWVLTASRAALVGGVVLVVSAVRDLVGGLGQDQDIAAVVIVGVLTLGGAVALLLLRNLALDPARNRRVAVGLAAGVALLGVVVLSVAHGVLDSAAAAEQLLGWFGLPGLALWSLTVPTAVRSQFGPLLPEENHRHAGTPAPPR